MAKPEHRTLRFESFDEAMQEAETLAAGPHQTTGSFSLGQIFEHLARTLEIASGNRDAPPSTWFMRTLSRMIRPMLLRKAVTGFKLPGPAQDILWPSKEVSVEDGIARLREAAEKFRAFDGSIPHSLFGNMSVAQHHQLQCRHFEGHLGFVHPQ